MAKNFNERVATEVVWTITAWQFKSILQNEAFKLSELKNNKSLKDLFNKYIDFLLEGSDKIPLEGDINVLIEGFINNYYDINLYDESEGLDIIFSNNKYIYAV